MPKELAKITLYSAEEIAEKLEVDITTIRRYIHSGRLKAQKVLGAYHVTEENLQEFMKHVPPADES